MALVTTSEVKTFLQISGSSKDTIIAALIPVMESILYGILGVDSLESHEVTKETVIMLIDEATGNYYGYVEQSPIISIDNIYEVDDTEIEDATIAASTEPNSRAFIIDWDTMNYRDNILVTYTAGFASIPEDLKYAVSLMIADSLVEPQKRGGVGSYSQGQRSVTFRSSAEANIFDSIMKVYGSRFNKVSILG